MASLQKESRDLGSKWQMALKATAFLPFTQQIFSASKSLHELFMLRLASVKQSLLCYNLLTKFA